MASTCRHSARTWARPLLPREQGWANFSLSEEHGEAATQLKKLRESAALARRRAAQAGANGTTSQIMVRCRKRSHGPRVRSPIGARVGRYGPPGLPIRTGDKTRYRNAATRAACSEITRALSSCGVPAGSPLMSTFGLDHTGRRGQPLQLAL